jgi:hypothetical protein
MAKVFQKDTNGTLTNGLISYYKMEGNSTDFWGSNNGTDTLVTYGTAYGKIGQGANFNGSSSKIALSQATSPFNNLAAGSFAFWIYLNSNTSAPIHFRQHDGTNTYACFSVGFYTSSGGLYAAGTAGKIYVHAANAQPLASSTTNLSTGQWYFVVVTFNGSNCSIYVNGALDSSTSGNFSIPNDISCTNDTFGYWSNGPYYLNAYIDEVGIWNRVLTSTEISDLYNGGAGNTMIYVAQSGAAFLYEFLSSN